MAMLAEWWNADGALGARPRELDSATASPPRGLFRHSASDAWLVGASVVQALVTIAAISILTRRSELGSLLATIAFGFAICWCSNTVSHNHLHSAFFRKRWQNRAFSLWLTAITGVPQTIWRERHLRHHAGERERDRRLLSRAAWLEIGLIGVLAIGLLAIWPKAFVCSIAPGYLFGMALCRLQGDMEHARDPRGVSHYGTIYNFFWFNDGYHVEHHRFPSAHWTELPAHRAHEIATESRFPPQLRWLETTRNRLSELKGSLLCALEQLAIRSAFVQRFVLQTHAKALVKVLTLLPAEPREVVVIGGGLFPRTLLLLGKILPRARFCVVEQSTEHVSIAVEELKRRRFDLGRVRFSIERFDPARHVKRDVLLVAPLGFVGSRELLDLANRQVALLSHDWIWQRRARSSRIVSWLLLKRINLALPGK